VRILIASGSKDLRNRLFTVLVDCIGVNKSDVVVVSSCRDFTTLLSANSFTHALLDLETDKPEDFDTSGRAMRAFSSLDSNARNKVVFIVPRKYFSEYFLLMEDSAKHVEVPWEFRHLAFELRKAMGLTCYVCQACGEPIPSDKDPKRCPSCSAELQVYDPQSVPNDKGIIVRGVIQETRSSKKKAVSARITPVPLDQSEEEELEMEAAA